MYSRRTFATIALGAASAPAILAKPDSKIKGVIIGVQSYSFRDRSLDEAIAAMSSIGLSYVELWSRHLEPKGATAEDVKKWRTSPEAVVQMKDVRRKFNRAGIRVYALNYSFRKEHSDDEILQGMEMAKALGTRYLTASSTVDQAGRINQLAAQKGVLVGMHNHANLKDPNEFATPDSFEKAMSGNSQIRVNLDLGHFVAANFDPVDYIRNNHTRILCVHVKDRRKNQGPNLPFGQGETPIKEVVQLLRDRRLQIPVMIEYEYNGTDAIAEVRKSYDFLRQALD